MAEELEARLRRLQQERAAADRDYNEALTALDRALRPPPEVPGAPAPYDEHQITPLNDAWNILPEPPRAGRGIRGRLTGLIWHVVAPFFQRQLTFNSRLVDHLNRNVAAERDARRATESLAAVLRDQLAHQAELASRLLYLLQRITPYVDTRDREAAGGALVLNAALGAFSDGERKRWESLAAREHRAEARAAALDAAHAELRTAVAVAQTAALTMKRELERALESGAAPPSGDGSPPASSGARAAAPAADAFSGRLDAYKYVAFEDQFRGSREAIRARLESYLPFFEGAGRVLDVGCGRGEFLDLLQARGIPARGLDLNSEMVEVCRARGLDAVHGDAVGYLSGLDDGALGGLFAAQVVEHLQPGYLLRFLELAFHKTAPGGRLVLETLNPACWVAFFESYIRDITHVWPLHPETLQYLVRASGFSDVRIEYRSPVPEQDKLQPVAVLPGDERLAAVAETMNANVERLNSRLFTSLDYAIVAVR